MILLFFLAAILYASVGLGGGSTYIALLAASQLPHTEIPQLSLLCNLVVVAGGCIHFFRAGYGDLRRLAPLFLASIPMAYVGGGLPLSKTQFMTALGLTLLAAGMRLIVGRQWAARLPREPRQTWVWGLSIGSVLGIVSGMVGIGGGIFLAPILYFVRWGDARGIAAATSLFILVNSLSGLIGQVAKSGMTVTLATAAPLMIAVLLGGQIGSRMAVHHMPPQRIQQLTGVFVLSIAVQLLWKGVAS